MSNTRDKTKIGSTGHVIHHDLQHEKYRPYNSERFAANGHTFARWRSLASNISFVRKKKSNTSSIRKIVEGFMTCLSDLAHDLGLTPVSTLVLDDTSLGTISAERREPHCIQTKKNIHEALGVLLHAALFVTKIFESFFIKSIISILECPLRIHKNRN
ncbi:hypothetical protein PsorP6_002729 [Peronosclerospora sorghi]|uniref:Uncharacterized protein n=1 Tax=Peronosclerospora sorghi TaxID=230839 RepID=A0ACC0WUW8_9STRA|nr:hypothetical protein PsorP6_002729 [Peronosclerospora sorghi]